MRKTATILVLLFLLVQAAPAVCSLFSVQTSLFMVDEEQGPEKAEKNDSKEFKNIHTPNNGQKLYAQKVHTAFLIAEKIALSPCLEKHTPPPDFS